MSTDRAAVPPGTDIPSPEADALVRTGERFGRTLLLSPDDIRSYASLVGDHNPLHHDEALAAASPVGGLIASGPHTMSVMMGCFATHFTRRDDGVARTALGMRFDTRFVAPVRPGELITIQWEVIDRQWKPRRSGWVVTARGTAASDASGLLIEMTGIGLVMPDRG